MYTVIDRAVLMQVTYLGVTKPSDLIIANHIQISLHADVVPTRLSSLSDEINEKSNDLNELLIKTPSTSFFVRMKGDSMIELGVYHDDVLVVDKSLVARHDDIVIAYVNGEMTIKSLEHKSDEIYRPKNKAYPASNTSKESKFEIMGVVTSVIRNVKRGSQTPVK